MTIQTQIEQKISEALAPTHLEVANESHMHAGPASESHFKLTVVAEAFTGEKRIDRHRRINRLLADELAGPVHALAIHALTPDEYFERAGQVPESPQCQGGSQGGSQGG